MHIPDNAHIDPRKLTEYLLAQREMNDKSGFLGRAGFVRENPHELETEIRRSACSADAIPHGENEYGEFYRQDGEIRGPIGRKLPVSLIWIRLKQDQSFRFVTLKPQKETRA